MFSCNFGRGLTMFVAAASLSSASGRALSQEAAPIKLHAEELSVTVDTRGGHLSGPSFLDQASGEQVSMRAPFVLKLSDGSEVNAAQLEAKPVTNADGVADPHRIARGENGVSAGEHCWEFAGAPQSLKLRWCLIANPGTHYVRELLQMDAVQKDVAIAEVRMLDFADSKGRVDGIVKGSPIVDANMFFGVEHPLSLSTVTGGEARAWMPRTLPLRSGQSITYSAVVGAAPSGQMRRRFLLYVESERPRPYAPFLHYNSWYDIGYENRFSEADVLDRIHAIGTQMVAMRHAHVVSFLLDDGWDDPNNLWALNAGFPHGLYASAKAAAQYGAGIGLWLSPWGGYAHEKQERVAYGRAHGYEILNDGYALSGPKYYERFQNTCLDMIRRYDVNQFKFDGTGNADRVFPGSEFDSDFDAAIHLIERLRRQKRDLFVNLTTGTTASPFWLFYADSIWRGGEDHDFAGVGTARQRWITYRDGQTYANIVKLGPLFPLNSLMLHGIIYAQKAKDLMSDPGGDFADEVHSYFGTGTQTQEMYITPSLLTAENWNTLADGAKWSEAHRETLRDTHWIGGDPGKLAVYGWAAWSPKEAIVTLRNPSDKPQTYTLHPAQALELGAGAARTYRLKNVWGPASALPADTFQADAPFTVTLKPFEVLTVEAQPSN